MTTDTTTDTKIRLSAEAERLFTNLDKPSLHGLSYALRHPDTWPEGFVWDYSDCKQCAMGLAHQLWESEIPQVGNTRDPSVMARKFAMPYEKAEQIFFATHKYNRHYGVFPRSIDSVTPEMVADQIDAYLAKAE